jgi:aspartate/methionine/tyrosine aminotransferase
MKKDVKACKDIQPANRLQSVSEYYFSKKLKEVDAMNAAGMNVINLGIGSPDLPPSESAREMLCEQTRRTDTHGYQPYTGIPELRRGFAEWYRKWYGVTLDPASEIQPLIGSKEGILHVSLTFLNPGDGVLAPDPGYPTYSSVSRLLGAQVIPYELDESTGWQPDLDALEQADLSNVKLMWVNYPHMPTGANAGPELFHRLVDFGKRHGIVIVNDNPYSFILNDRRHSILQVEGAKEICIELNSMSKSHNMPGWRIALLASNPTFISWVLRVKSNIDSGQFKPMMLAAVEALKNPAEWHNAMNAEYRKRRLIAEQIMQAMDCTFDRQQTGLFLWGKIPEKYTDSSELADRILYRANVFITPGLIFGNKGRRYVRLSLCCKEASLNEALQRIQTIQTIQTKQ